MLSKADSNHYKQNQNLSNITAYSIMVPGGAGKRAGPRNMKYPVCVSADGIFLMRYYFLEFCFAAMVALRFWEAPHPEAAQASARKAAALTNQKVQRFLLDLSLIHISSMSNWSTQKRMVSK